jgi:hypothetical protein
MNAQEADQDPYVKNGRIVIRSSVDMIYGEDVAYYSVSAAEWFGMTGDAQNKFCADIAVEHQNTVAPCGASIIPWSEATDGEVLSYD